METDRMEVLKWPFQVIEPRSYPGRIIIDHILHSRVRGCSFFLFFPEKPQIDPH